MSNFLTEIVEQKGISIRNWCDGVGVAESTARWHLKAKRIPDPKCWKRISRFLNIPMPELEMLFREELEKQDRIVYCAVCQAEFYQFGRKLLCGSPDCLRSYDRARKALQRKKGAVAPARRLSEADFHAVSSMFRKKVPQITREELSVKVDEYLESGGKITRLAPTVADGLIPESWGERNTAQQRTSLWKWESSIYNDF